MHRFLIMALALLIGVFVLASGRVGQLELLAWVTLMGLWTYLFVRAGRKTSKVDL
ncbi:MAG: hypothetical protein ACRCYU_17445 [Nocardioides sp.]